MTKEEIEKLIEAVGKQVESQAQEFVNQVNRVLPYTLAQTFPEAGFSAMRYDLEHNSNLTAEEIEKRCGKAHEQDR